MSLPREVHEVLEQEYVSMYGPLTAVGARYTIDQISDARWATSILRSCDLVFDDLTAEAVLEKLNSYVDSRPPAELLKSPAMTTGGRALLEQYNVMNDEATEEGKLPDLNRRIIDDAFGGAVKALRDVRLKNVYDHLHARAKKDKGNARSALCISGGGIRSATFALGVIQGLASAKVLDKFDYLSTVSGGGYIGSWLSSWSRRHSRGMTGVQDDLARTDTGVGGFRDADDKTGPATRCDELVQKVDPEPKPVRHLREYSNYLSPRLGLLSGDTWTMVAMYCRNLLLNLLVLVPILAAVLAIPRLFAALSRITNDVVDVGYAYATAACLTWAFGYIGFKRPVDGAQPKIKLTKLSADSSYIVGCVLPLLLASVSMALFWTDVWREVNDGRRLVDARGVQIAALLSLLAMTAVPFFIYYIRALVAFMKSSRTTHASVSSQLKHLAIKGGQELSGAMAGLGTALALLVLLALKVFDDPMRPLDNAIAAAQQAPALRAGVDMMPWAALYTCFAVPAILLVFYIQASIFVGVSSRRNEDFDREWWGRAGAWVLISAAAWAVLSGIAVFGPVAINNAPILIASVGGISGIAAAVLGFSAKTPANKKEKEAAGVGGKAGNAALSFAVPLFVAFFLALIAHGTTWLTWQIKPLFPETFAGYQKIEWSTYASRAQLQSKLEKVEKPAEGVELKQETAAGPLVSIPLLKSLEHLRTVYNTSFWEVGVLGFLALLAWGLSALIGVNKFSMHALYRNRLIRAYLGASRYTRSPHPFTGFDEKDNLQMHQLRPELMWPANVIDPKVFIETFKEASNNGVGDLTGLLRKRRLLAQHLWTRFYRKTRIQIGDRVTASVIDAVVQNLNVLIANERTRFEDVPGLDLGKDFWATREREGELPYPVVMRNRAVLDHCFDGVIASMPLPDAEAERQKSRKRRPPIHVVNMALNLVGGEKLAWQQRKAESFTSSPYHSGSPYLGYRDSHRYGGDDGISVGTAVTISGAAASPNMGYHSSPALAFLLTLFNIRLGWWLGNPGPVGQKSYRKSHPGSNLAPLAAEATGKTNDSYPWVYLSDGGHFENLGLYEMVLRRCHNVVLSDAGADPGFAFDDLGNAIRKIRTDLGVPIDIEHMFMFPRSADGSEREGRYVATATIRYSAVDGDHAENGRLIYIKPGVYKDSYFPRDVYNYAKGAGDFPHESTADQFFSESQFESYRALGRHAVNEICCNYADPNPPEPKLPIAKEFKHVAHFAGFVERQADLTTAVAPHEAVAAAIRQLSPRAPRP